MSHAYGPAVEVPGWIAGLCDPGTAAQCLSELYGSITHQGSRHAVVRPFAGGCGLDRSVVDRAGVVFLIGFCAMGYSGDWLDWRNQRRVQAGSYERASWNAVVAERGRLRSCWLILTALATAALTVLGWHSGLLARRQAPDGSAAGAERQQAKT